MSRLCPTCGHPADNELVHTTPLDEWHRDLTELIWILRGVMRDDQAATDRRLRTTRITSGRRGRAIQLRRVA